jgi:hypothetical protein
VEGIAAMQRRQTTVFALQQLHAAFVRNDGKIAV